MATRTWAVDPAHTDVQFSAKHMMVTTVRGAFREVAGSITLDPSRPEDARGEFSVEVASLSTGVEQRDAHLRSADFFATGTWPSARFVVTAVEPGTAGSYSVTGDLTIRDTTLPVTFKVEVLGFHSGMNGERRVGLHAAARLDREAFGLTWNVALEGGGWLVGKEVALEMDLAFEETAARLDAAA
jgi:polyisoprenoid-binding protein YceI